MVSRPELREHIRRQQTRQYPTRVWMDQQSTRALLHSLLGLGEARRDIPERLSLKSEGSN